MSQSSNKAERIRSLALFRAASDEAVDHLSSAIDEVSIDAGTTVINQGRRHSEGYAVSEGTAEVLVDGEVVAEIGAGEMFGELALLDGAPASATVRAKTAMSLMVIPNNHFDQIMDDNPAMVKEIAKELAGRLRAMDERAL